VRYGSIAGLEYEVPQQLTHLLQCIHILHNFLTSTHRGEASPLPPSPLAAPLHPIAYSVRQMSAGVVVYLGVCRRACHGHGDYAEGRCVCHVGWTGGQCDVPLTDCDNDHAHHPVCSGNGRCVDDGTCLCAAGFTGQRCQIGAYASTSRVPYHLSHSFISSPQNGSKKNRIETGLN